MMNLRVLPVLLGLLLLSVASFAAEPVDLNNAAWSLKISNGLEGTKELNIDVTTRFGLFATSVAQKGVDMQLVPSIPKIDDKGIKGDLTINIKKVLSTFTLDVTVKDGVVDGKYTGTATLTPLR